MHAASLLLYTSELLMLNDRQNQRFEVFATKGLRRSLVVKVMDQIRHLYVKEI